MWSYFFHCFEEDCLYLNERNKRKYQELLDPVDTLFPTFEDDRIDHY